MGTQTLLHDCTDKLPRNIGFAAVFKFVWLRTHLGHMNNDKNIKA